MLRLLVVLCFVLEDEGHDVFIVCGDRSFVKVGHDVKCAFIALHAVGAATSALYCGRDTERERDVF